MTHALPSAGAAVAAAGPLHRLSLGLAGLAGWRRWLAAFGIGALATFALPPANAVPLLWVAFPLLLWLLRGAGTGGQAFWTGWWFAFGHHVFGLYWISVALWVDIGRFWWAVPFAVAGLPAVLAVFAGIATLAHRWAVRRFHLTGAAEALAFAAAWALLEYARGHLFTGFPWNLIGYVWTDTLPVLQLASVLGIYGLSLLTVAAASLPVALADRDPARPAAWAGTAVGLALLAGTAAWGAARMSGTEGQVVEGVRLRLVQAAIPQNLKWDRDTRLANFQKHLELSAGPGWEGVTHIVWPETAVPYLVDQDVEVARAIGSVTPQGGVTLTGAIRIEDRPDKRHYFNSLFAVQPNGRVAAGFDKFHLVPFGEYMPFSDILPVRSIAAGVDQTPGPGPRTLTLPGLPPFSPLICYEGIFPGAVAPEPGAGQERPRWLLNITNDAWYGETAGPHQHFAIVQVRAVEEGMPVVRAANTGISGVVDAYGRVTAELGLGEQGVLDADLPMAGVEVPPYGQYGDWLFVVALLCVMGLVGFFARQV